MKKCVIPQRFCSEKSRIIHKELWCLMDKREGKDVQKYSVLLKNSVFVMVRDCICQPHDDNEGAL